MLDATRTGVAAESTDPADAYSGFALSANDILRSADGEPVAFSARLTGASVEPEVESAWTNHLTTLFPEVRPRGHFEVRSCDAVAPEWYAAPIVFVAALAYDPRASSEAALLAADSASLLRTAGHLGLREPSLARTARDLFQLALEGAARLGPASVGGAELEAARAFFSKYTSRDSSPADGWVLPARARSGADSPSERAVSG
jgi:glutamate--cysteine ligase